MQLTTENYREGVKIFFKIAFNKRNFFQGTAVST